MHTVQKQKQNFLDLFLDESGGERFEGFVYQVMLRIADGGLERVNFDSDAFDLEHGHSSFAGRNEMDGNPYDLCEHYLTA